MNVNIFVAFLKFQARKFISGAIIFSAKNYSACDTFMASAIVNVSFGKTTGWEEASMVIDLERSPVALIVLS